MQKYVALLRGINVGGNKKVEMSKLRKVFESLGFTDVSTYINSGNIIFHSKKAKSGIDVEAVEKSLKKTFGFSIGVVVREANNIEKVAKGIPSVWKNDAEMKTDVLFLWEKFNHKKSIKLLAINPEVDRLKYVDGALIWSIDRKKYNQSGMRKFIGTTLYKNMTARNVNTVRKLASLMKSKD